MNSTKIRLATEGDLASINSIYNQAVLQRFTADTIAISLARRKEWFKAHDDSFPVFVFIEKEAVVGWLSFSPYRYGRKALKETAEISYYVDKDFHKKGIGTALVNFAKEVAVTYRFKNLFAVILENNKDSIRLMEKSCFVKWGFLPEVANFDGELCGHVYYGINL